GNPATIHVSAKDLQLTRGPADRFLQFLALRDTTKRNFQRDLHATSSAKATIDDREAIPRRARDHRRRNSEAQFDAARTGPSSGRKVTLNTGTPSRPPAAAEK